MIRRQLMAVLAVVVAVTFNTATAQGKPGKGIFEAPMVDVTLNVEVPGSEGKIEREGAFKVEIPGVAAGTYRVCLFHNDTVSHFLGTALVGEDGELAHDARAHREEVDHAMHVGAIKARHPLRDHDTTANVHSTVHAE